MRDLEIENHNDLNKWVYTLDAFKQGKVSEDAFRAFRLANGIYGQRQGGTNQMVRVKIPGGVVTSEQLVALGKIANEYSRGWGHITTRQNIQFHYVQLDDIAQVMHELHRVGLTTREACGDTVRNTQACHLAGACPLEKLNVQGWADITHEHFLRNPISQRLPRKFKINFSGCDVDCGQALINDAGVIATVNDDGEAGFRVYVGGGLGANPHPAQLLEDFTPKQDLLPTLEALLRMFDRVGNRDNKLRARLKWFVQEHGIDELRRQVFRDRELLLASSTFPSPIEVRDEPTLSNDYQKPTAVGVPVELIGKTRHERWDENNVVYGAKDGTVSVNVHIPLGDLTASSFDELASIADTTDTIVKLTNRQNVVFCGMRVEDVDYVKERLERALLAEPAVQLSRDVVACPGTDTCNLGLTQSRGLADAITAALENLGLAEVDGVKINISGCSNSCGQHHIADIGFHGIEKRHEGKSIPGYNVFLGGGLKDGEVVFGKKVFKVAARHAPDLVVELVQSYVLEREFRQSFAEWLEENSDFVDKLSAVFKDRPITGDDYVDFGEKDVYAASVGASECR